VAEKKLNLLGEVCPYPLLKTQKELEKIASGEVIMVETDFNQSVRNIIKWCEDQGHEFRLDEIDNGFWLITIIKQ